ncbi:hypothetical protein [Alteromonas stellipolaris]|uniref:DUF4386 family protein n=1 Tax=Alteromonas stellipolaris TaxID=233316 RepID=A0ABM5YHG8_9ALTE|nr:hypothetical protein [Alteromonas stellipolaris]ALM90617.1 hypothetical protein AOR13_1581 [Alteromonas stellipolaris LMG 21856]AMJ73681.1 hypothetical protein AVL57_06655 [Alteromonas stellipolaris]ANB27183.1 hypothetical protein A6F57_19550 [Alteromonas stellipolaris]MBZ2162417.1 hypothetical protein [Alteromonas stellipolaris]MDO6537913.1 hypothetical protein [Alteromonas stellipolaris]
MRKKQFHGAIASFICATSFILGLCLIFIIAPDFNDGPDQRLRTLNNFSELMQVWYFLVYVVFGISVLVLSVSLLENQTREHSVLQQITMLMSYLWSCYIFASGFIAILSVEFLFGENFKLGTAVVDLWRDIYAIQMGLGEGSEWVGAIWVMLINTCLLKEQRLSKNLVLFGYIISFFGFLTLIPSLKEIGAVFGLLQIIWFILVGSMLLHERRESQQHVTIDI